LSPADSSDLLAAMEKLFESQRYMRIDLTRGKFANRPPDRPVLDGNIPHDLSS